MTIRKRKKESKPDPYALAQMLEASEMLDGSDLSSEVIEFFMGNTDAPLASDRLLAVVAYAAQILHKQGALKPRTRPTLPPPRLKMLRFIAERITQARQCPSYTEICAYMGFKTRGTVTKHVRTLATDGYIERQSGKRRSITITPKGESIL